MRRKKKEPIELYLAVINRKGKEVLCAWDDVNDIAYYVNSDQTPTTIIIMKCKFIRNATIEDIRNLKEDPFMDV